MFRNDNLKQGLAPSALQIVCMIKNSAGIKSQLQHGASKSDFAMSELLQLNGFFKYRQRGSTDSPPKMVETPAVCVGMCLLAKFGCCITSCYCPVVALCHVDLQLQGGHVGYRVNRENRRQSSETDCSADNPELYSVILEP